MSEKTYTVALTGNPNVGKSTVFNALTGLRQHTGNWAGKTVGCAYGKFSYKGEDFTVVDLPGCYTASSDVGEERGAARFLAFNSADVTVTVCDATCLSRNLILALQVAEMSRSTVLCVNLLDEAEKKGIRVDLEGLGNALGVTVIGACARKGNGLNELKEAVFDCVKTDKTNPEKTFFIDYGEKINSMISAVGPKIRNIATALGMSERYLSLELLKDSAFTVNALRDGGYDVTADRELLSLIERERMRTGLNAEMIRASVFHTLTALAESTAARTVTASGETAYERRCRRLDRIVTGRYTAYPIMALLLSVILWITVEGANYPSAMLSKWLFSLEDVLYGGAISVGIPPAVCGALIHGAYRVLAWVVSVMLPPMAIFFPLFTLLEDLGLLPRIAFNLDSSLKRCNACGKQALTMCMGLGCNAVGVTGCRIIDSKRERLIAVLTNVFMPCNGRFPTLITVITMFFVLGGGVLGGLTSALLLTLIICLGISLTFAASLLLSKTLLRGVPSAFTLELPPYRTPDVPSVIFRSVIDRTVFVLGRAAAVSAPAGLLIWVMANLSVGGATVLSHAVELLSPVGNLLGLDGVILLAFLLGFPANEIVLPIAIMTYTGSSAVSELSGNALRTLLIENGWNTERAISVILFCLCHFPCSTTLMTVYKETGSKRVTLLSAVIPTAVGVILCMLNHLIFTII